MNSTEKFFVECVKRGIKKEKIEFVPDGLDYQQFYKLCAAHSMSVAVVRALEDVKHQLPSRLLHALETSAYCHLTYDIQSVRDVETLLTALEERGFRYMPLKGYYLKKLYPSSDMRYASDFDILIDVQQLGELRAAYKELGLLTMRYDEHHDIVYYPRTNTLFELHKTLFVGRLEDYFGKGNKGFEGTAIKEGHRYFHEMDKEKFYISLLAHSAQHFATGAGVGIRHLTDVYLYRKAYTLDEAYFDIELSKCGLQQFKDEFEKAARFLFDEDASVEPFTEKLISHVLASSVLANREKKSASDVVSTGRSDHKEAQKKAFWQKIFLPTEQMRFQFPILKKAIWLLPVFHVVRWVKVVFTRPKALGQLKSIADVSREEVAYMRELRAGLGIEQL